MSKLEDKLKASIKPAAARKPAPGKAAARPKAAPASAPKPSPARPAAPAPRPARAKPAPAEDLNSHRGVLHPARVWPD